MNTRSDWMPGTRAAQLGMAKDWIDALKTKSAGWKMPQEAVVALENQARAAELALNVAQNEATRTPVSTAQCKEMFDALSAAMRDVKKRYFLSPPLSDSDYIALKLKPHDNVPTPQAAPTAQVRVETYLAGRHELGIKIVYVTGSAGEQANKGYRIWYSVYAHGETPPNTPDDLRKSFYTQRKKDFIEFEFGDSGKTVYFAVQVENGGKKGPWGPLVPAVIP